jgi:hypothetical protein
VYYTADYPDVLFKVLLDLAHVRQSGFRGWSLKYFPATRARAFFKEYESAVRIQMCAKGGTGDIPISRLFGLVQTDLGPASIVERIHCDDGPIGPTLSDLKRTSAFSDEHIPLLNDFAHRILAWQVRTTDMNGTNVVFGVRDGRPQFVLVDGIGDNFAIPLRTWSVTAMKTGQSESFAKIARDLGISWDGRNWRFGLVHGRSR